MTVVLNELEFDRDYCMNKDVTLHSQNDVT